MEQNDRAYVLFSQRACEDVSWYVSHTAQASQALGLLVTNLE
ncbi:hypothetical protein [Alteromonas pelagimontana]|nr:hypothetical protein [Alteromonas pelagimontana]